MERNVLKIHIAINLPSSVSFSLICNFRRWPPSKTKQFKTFNTLFYFYCIINESVSLTKAKKFEQITSSKQTLTINQINDIFRVSRTREIQNHGTYTRELWMTYDNDKMF